MTDNAQPKTAPAAATGAALAPEFVPQAQAAAAAKAASVAATETAPPAASPEFVSQAQAAAKAASIGGTETPRAFDEQGFTIINPPLPVYRPKLEGKTERLIAYPLARREMTGGVFYYVLQVIHPTEAAVRRAGPVSLGPGAMVLVKECQSLAALAHLLPDFGQSNGVVTAANEVILEPRRELDSWAFLVSAKHVTGKAAENVKSAPHFALVDAHEEDIPELA